MSFVSEQVFGILGNKTRKKIIVIESDDWGLQRMPSKKAFENLKKAGFPVETCPYNLNDSLENVEDISRLNDFCEKFKDKNGNSLKITANFIMSNPDFEKVKESNFEEYCYLKINDIYNFYQGNLNTLTTIKEAYKNGTFIPQLHGREHLQVNHWLNALRIGDNETWLAFNEGVFGHPSNYGKNSGINFLSAFHISSNNELKFIIDSVSDGALIFKEIFGYKSDTFIAPRYIWPLELESYFKDNDIKSLQGTHVQLIPRLNNKNIHTLAKQINWMGKRNKNGLGYLCRNVFFEPTLRPSFSWEKDALRRIDTAFYWGKPAIISTHRLNFMGGFSSENRETTLSRLRNLIQQVQKKHKEIVFASSNELINL